MIFAVLEKPGNIEGFDGVELRFESKKKYSIPVIRKGDQFHLHPQYVDLDHDTDKAFIKKRKEQYPAIKIILSYHNFEETPKNLSEIYESMQSPYVDIYKIACQPKNFLDVLRIIEFNGIALGEMGQISRLLSPIGYVSDPLQFGQLSFGDLKKKDVYALIGNPVSQSVGHIYHNQKIAELGLDALYLKIPLMPEELPQFFKNIHKLRIKGLSVTMPLKEKVVPFLDEIRFSIPVVNTICVEDGKLVGYNTDGLGALDVLGNVNGKKVVLLGTGGAAKAIHYTLTQEGAHVLMLKRHEMAPPSDILINCTPVQSKTPLELHIQNPFGLQMFYAQARHQAALFYLRGMVRLS